MTPRMLEFHLTQIGNYVLSFHSEWELNCI